MKKAFKIFDSRGTGKINLADLKRTAEDLGEKTTDEEHQQIIEESDTSGEGEITYEDFLLVMKRHNLL